MSDDWEIFQPGRLVPVLDVSGIAGIERALDEFEFIGLVCDHEGGEADRDAEFFRLAWVSP